MTGRHFDPRAIRRILAAYADSAGDGDIGSLSELVELNDVIADLIEKRVKRMLELGYSWRQIADALGIRKSWAHERYGRLGSSRRPGGQPADRR